jgi:FK506-binding protein 1
MGRGDFKTPIGVGRVIKGTQDLSLIPERWHNMFQCDIRVADRSTGWDEGVLSVDGGMTLGEKATLVITGYEHCSR